MVLCKERAPPAVQGAPKVICAERRCVLCARMLCRSLPYWRSHVNIVYGRHVMHSSSRAPRMTKDRSALLQVSEQQDAAPVSAHIANAGNFSVLRGVVSSVSWQLQRSRLGEAHSSEGPKQRKYSTGLFRGIKGSFTSFAARRHPCSWPLAHQSLTCRSSSIPRLWSTAADLHPADR